MSETTTDAAMTELEALLRATAAKWIAIEGAQIITDDEASDTVACCENEELAMAIVAFHGALPSLIARVRAAEGDNAAMMAGWKAICNEWGKWATDRTYPSDEPLFDQMRKHHNDITKPHPGAALLAERDADRAELARLRAEVARLGEARTKAVDLMDQILAIHWGWDGDCGARGIADDARDILMSDAALAAKEGENVL
jgi:hypothetical protein